MSAFATLSGRERRVVLVGVGVLIVAVTALRVIPAWREWVADTRAVAAVSVAELERTRRGIAAVPRLRDSLLVRNDRYLALAPSILTGSSSGGIAADLASLVSGAAAGAGIELGAISIRPDTTKDRVFSRPSVKGDARGDIMGLARFLAAVEGGSTILVVRQLAVTQPEPGAPGDRAEALRIEFVIEGIALERPSVEGSGAAAIGVASRGPLVRGRAP